MIVNILRASAINAFFFPRREANFQYFTESSVFLDFAAAQAASQSAVLTCGLPFTVFVLFFYLHSHGFREQLLPRMPGDPQLKIDPYRHQFQQECWLL